jgi:phage-related holin
MMNTTVFHLTPSDGPLVVSHFLSGIITSPVIRDVVSECLIEITDKTLSLVLAAVVALLLNDILNTYQPDQ